jgi:hypothetical protein
MSGWGMGWFGGGAAKKEAPKKAILGLRSQLEMLNKREKHLENQMSEQDALARKHISTNKNGRLHFYLGCEGVANSSQQRPRQHSGERRLLRTRSSRHRRKSSP